MTPDKVASYVGSLIAIALGSALVWFPPASIADQAGTFLVAGALWTGGLGGLGITVAIPALRESARREVRAARRASTARAVAAPTPE